MVDKRSLRSSKKEGQETPAEEEKPKPTRTRSGRSRKAPSKSQKGTASVEEPTTTTTDATPAITQSEEIESSEDVIMETQGEAIPEKPNENEDVEMKNANEEAKDGEEETTKEAATEDSSASPLTGIIVS
jgi:hypothetical protein